MDAVASGVVVTVAEAVAEWLNELMAVTAAVATSGGDGGGGGGGMVK